MKFAVIKTPPEYSGVAKQMRVTGRVEIEVVVETDGTMESIKAISGNPLLTAPSIAAVKKWKFNPILVNGEAVKAITTLAFDFK